jgi:nicotinamide-nucleotide adenylyltransferase
MRSAFVGRFQPVHRGHIQSIRQILDKGEDVIIVIGSSQYSHTPDNPFTGGERSVMFKLALLDEDAPLERIDIVPLSDIHVHPLWVSHLKSFTPHFEKAYTHNPLVRSLFRDAGVPVDSTKLLKRANYSGSHIRSLMRSGGKWETLVPEAVAKFIRENSLDVRVREVGTTTTKR